MEFLTRNYQTFSLNGSTPHSFEELEKATLRLVKIGGQLVIGKLDDHGLSLQLIVPIDAKDVRDANAKIRLISRELKNFHSIS